MKYIISDVHGCYETLMKLIQKLPKDTKCSEVIFVGDLIDRGPDSRKVIDFVKNGGYDIVLGNHENLLIDVWDDYVEYKTPLNSDNMWTQNGGYACLANYTSSDGEIDYMALGIDVQWMKTLPSARIYNEEVDTKGRKLVITHAVSIDFIDRYVSLLAELNGKELEELTIDEEHRINNMSQLIVWNRSLPKTGSDNFFNISGHNIIDHFIFDGMNQLKIPKETLTPEHILLDKEKGFACIDTGAFSKYDPYHNENCGETNANPYRGRMTCIEFPSFKVYQQCNAEEFDWR